MTVGTVANTTVAEAKDERISYYTHVGGNTKQNHDSLSHAAMDPHHEANMELFHAGVGNSSNHGQQKGRPNLLQ